MKGARPQEGGSGSRRTHRCQCEEKKEEYCNIVIEECTNVQRSREPQRSAGPANVEPRKAASQEEMGSHDQFDSPQAQRGSRQGRRESRQAPRENYDVQPQTDTYVQTQYTKNDFINPPRVYTNTGEPQPCGCRTAVRQKSDFEKWIEQPDDVFMGLQPIKGPSACKRAPCLTPKLRYTMVRRPRPLGKDCSGAEICNPAMQPRYSRAFDNATMDFSENLSEKSPHGSMKSAQKTARAKDDSRHINEVYEEQLFKTSKEPLTEDTQPVRTEEDYQQQIKKATISEELHEKANTSEQNYQKQEIGQKSCIDACIAAWQEQQARRAGVTDQTYQEDNRTIPSKQMYIQEESKRAASKQVTHQEDLKPAPAKQNSHQEDIKSESSKQMHQQQASRSAPPNRPAPANQTYQQQGNRAGPANQTYQQQGNRAGPANQTYQQQGNRAGPANQQQPGRRPGPQNQQGGKAFESRKHPSVEAWKQRYKKDPTCDRYVCGQANTKSDQLCPRLADENCEDPSCLATAPPEPERRTPSNIDLTCASPACREPFPYRDWTHSAPLYKHPVCPGQEYCDENQRQRSGMNPMNDEWSTMSSRDKHFIYDEENVVFTARNKHQKSSRSRGQVSQDKHSKDEKHHEKLKSSTIRKKNSLFANENITKHGDMIQDKYDKPIKSKEKWQAQSSPLKTHNTYANIEMFNRGIVRAKRSTAKSILDKSNWPIHLPQSQGNDSYPGDGASASSEFADLNRKRNSHINSVKSEDTFFDQPPQMKDDDFYIPEEYYTRHKDNETQKKTQNKKSRPENHEEDDFFFRTEKVIKETKYVEPKPKHGKSHKKSEKDNWDNESYQNESKSKVQSHRRYSRETEPAHKNKSKPEEQQRRPASERIERQQGSKAKFFDDTEKDSRLYVIGKEIEFRCAASNTSGQTEIKKKSKGSSKHIKHQEKHKKLNNEATIENFQSQIFCREVILTSEGGLMVRVNPKSDSDEHIDSYSEESGIILKNIEIKSPKYDDLHMYSKESKSKKPHVKKTIIQNKINYPPDVLRGIK